jgi:hypothetical protein
MVMDRPLRKEGVLLEKLEDECLLYDENQMKLHVLNPVAGFVWEMCDGATSISDMEEKVRENFEVPGEVTLKEDLLDIIREFADLELLSFPAR